MLDWMKDKLARRQSPLQALVAGAYKDDDEKRALLELLGAEDKLKADELLPLLAHSDAQIVSRSQSLFLARATREATAALIDAALADANALPALTRVLARVKTELVRAALDAVLRDSAPERMPAVWELVMELGPESSEPYVDRAFREGGPKARYEALRRILARAACVAWRSTRW
jgi:hypothetical protein